jgi:hypothetical protein
MLDDSIENAGKNCVLVEINDVERELKKAFKKKKRSNFETGKATKQDENSFESK